MKDYDIENYWKKVAATNRFAGKCVTPILRGLFGEVGSVMSVAKKYRREEKVYTNFRSNLTEELGDVFWYFTALAQHLDLWPCDLDSFISETKRDNDSPRPRLTKEEKIKKQKKTMSGICDYAARLQKIEQMIPAKQHTDMKRFLGYYFSILDRYEICFSHVLKENIEKTDSCFVKFEDQDLSSFPTFDCEYEEKERLPRKFKIEIEEDDDKMVKILFDGDQLGDMLNDNIDVEDGFRYHDVLHFSHLAILHWSPTMRGFLHRKRKSNKRVDENQDGGRAIVIEEGLTAWLFSRAKNANYFEGHEEIPMDILKTIQEFVRGYEVEQCPMNLWKHCIITGFNVFRDARKHRGGLIFGDMEKRTLEFRKRPDK